MERRARPRGGRLRLNVAAAAALVFAVGVAAVGGRVPVTEVAAGDLAPSGAVGGGPDGGGGDLGGGLAIGDSDDGGASAADVGTGAGAGQSGAGGPGAGGPGAGATGSGAGAPASTGPVRVDDGITDTEIKIGGSTFTSGPAAVYGEQIAVGFTAGVQYVNDNGGVNGRKLSLTLYDDGGDPAKQLANTKRLLEVDKVFALSMVYAPTVGEYVASKGVPVVHLGQFNEEFTNPWWFPVGGPQRVAAFWLEDYVVKNTTTKKAAIFYLDGGANNYSVDYARDLQDDWARHGVDASVLVPFGIDQTSCSDAIGQAKAANVDFIMFEIDASRVINCGIEAQIQGYSPPQGWGGYLIGVPVVPQALGGIADGMLAVDAFGALYDVPAYAEYIRKISPRTDAYSSVTMSYFIAALLLRDGLAQLGDDLTREHLRDVLNTFTDWRPGLTDDPNQPTWTWTPQCHAALQGGYMIEIQREGDGYAWKQITSQLQSLTLPPGKPVPPGFSACPAFKGK